MKKLSVFAIALAFGAALLTGCHGGNVSDRNDGTVNGTNSTIGTAATTPHNTTGTTRETTRSTEATRESTHSTEGTRESTHGTEGTWESTQSTQASEGARGSARSTTPTTRTTEPTTRTTEPSTGIRSR